MAPNKTASSNKLSKAKLSSVFDEQEWVIHIRTSLEEEIDEDDMKTPSSIYCIPQSLTAGKPEAYVPQLFAFGPYHHWRPQLYDMERYKVAAARNTQAHLNGLKFDQIVEKFMQREYKIRCYYHKYLDVSAETLAWMMAIDASFLLEFIDNYAEKQGRTQQEAPARTLSERMEKERMTMAYNMILGDSVMLENQIPLFLLRKLLSILNSSSKEAAEVELSKMLVGFIKELSPFKAMDTCLPIVDNIITRHPHLLELLYRTIVRKPKEPPAAKIEEIVEQNVETKPKDDAELIGDPSLVRKVFNWVWGFLSDLNGGPIGFIKRVFISKPVMFIVQFPWKVITALPVVSIIKLPVENFFSQLAPEESKSDDQSSHIDKPPLVEEIAIPSVSELVQAGVQFCPTNGDLLTIKFDTKTVTMYLPIISLDVNTEVVLRNLVAYEASAIPGPLVFKRYTELMNGIIDTEEDVKILREKGIVENRLKSDGEAAEVWNGMSKSVRLTKVEFLDRAIADVNKYYGSRLRVKSMEFMRKYVFGSWQVLTVLAAALLLFMTCVQAFCSVYSCSSHLTKITSIGD